MSQLNLNVYNYVYNQITGVERREHRWILHYITYYLFIKDEGSMIAYFLTFSYEELYYTNLMSV